MSLAAEWVWAALVSLVVAGAYGVAAWLAWRADRALRVIEDAIRGEQ